MSRSLGDGDAKKVGVLAEPMVKATENLQAKGSFMVIASDGVWDMLDNKTVQKIVDRYRKLA
jgi:serine/threonine protein phosphatase PrpC